MATRNDGPDDRRVLVCGGRGYNDWRRVSDVLRELHDRTPISLLIHGGARGADRIAEDWAILAAIKTQCFEADWAVAGRAAGPIRNAQMLKEGAPDLVIAFPGGPGTADMVRQAIKAGVTVMDLR